MTIDGEQQSWGYTWHSQCPSCQ